MLLSKGNTFNRIWGEAQYMQHNKKMYNICCSYSSTEACGVSVVLYHLQTSSPLRLLQTQTHKCNIPNVHAHIWTHKCNVRYTQPQLCMCPLANTRSIWGYLGQVSVDPEEKKRHMWKRDKGGTDCSTDRGKWATKERNRKKNGQKRNEWAMGGEKKGRKWDKGHHSVTCCLWKQFTQREWAAEWRGERKWYKEGKQKQKGAIQYSRNTKAVPFN